MEASTSFDSKMAELLSITEEIKDYVDNLNRCGLSRSINKKDIQLKVNELLSKGLSKEHVLDTIYSDFDYLLPGDILICNNKTYIVDGDARHIRQIQIDEAVEHLRDRMTNKAGKPIIFSYSHKSFSGIYVDGTSIASNSYSTLKIVCLHRKGQIGKVCSVKLFKSTDYPKEYLRNGMQVCTIKSRIFKYSSEPKISAGLVEVLKWIKNPYDIVGMREAIEIISNGPVIEFDKSIDSDTKHFDFVSLSLRLVYNGRTYKEQVDYVKNCIKALDSIVIAALKHNSTFKKARIGLNFFKVEKALTKQNILIYKLSIKGIAE